MELRVLSYFLAVAEEENISHAATKMHISQPSLSKYIRALESEVGEALFVRGTRNVTLTERGILFRERVRELMTIAEELQTDFMYNRSPMETDIHVGVGYSFAIQLLSQATEHIYWNHPKTRYHFFNGSPKTILEKVNDGLLDFAIAELPLDEEKYDYEILPLKATWGLLVRSDCPVAAKNIVEPGDILNARLIFNRQTDVADKL